jgi:hypothetical protein
VAVRTERFISGCVRYRARRLNPRSLKNRLRCLFPRALLRTLRPLLEHVMPTTQDRVIGTPRLPAALRTRTQAAFVRAAQLASRKERGVYQRKLAQKKNLSQCEGFGAEALEGTRVHQDGREGKGLATR